MKAFILGFLGIVLVWSCASKNPIAKKVNNDKKMLLE